MIDFTIAIPTYNGAKRLPDVLDGLRSQIDLDSLRWEVIVVDNNSNDGTAQVVRDYQSHWPVDSPLRYAFEPEQGAAFARQHAIAIAQGNYVGFLDDDNIPDPNWIRTAYDFGEAHPQVGAWGSEVRGDFIVPPPESLPPRLYCYLGIIDRGPQAHRYEAKTRMLPPAAGLVVRREAWRQAVPQRLFLNHTGKEAGLASEDLEAVLYLQLGGWEIWHNPEMKVGHKIPPERCEKEYLLALLRCIGLSRHHLRMLRLPPWQRPLATPLYWANDLRKLLKHLGQHRKAVEMDVGVVCDRQLLMSTLLSPFFLGKIAYENWRKGQTTQNPRESYSH